MRQSGTREKLLIATQGIFVLLPAIRATSAGIGWRHESRRQGVSATNDGVADWGLVRSEAWWQHSQRRVESHARASITMLTGASPGGEYKSFDRHILRDLAPHITPQCPNYRLKVSPSS